jgi:hypothetical protein
LPAELGKLTELEQFLAFNNQLTGMMSDECCGSPACCTALTNLHCVPPGSLPAELGKLNKLRELGVAENQLTLLKVCQTTLVAQALLQHCLAVHLI